jgi:ATP-dependent DNA ligase
MPRQVNREKRTSSKTKSSRIESGAVPERTLEENFPAINLPIRPPYPPMEAKSVAEIPGDDGWQYEPKWDGFRCLAFCKGKQVILQSKAGQPLGRYFPELVQALADLPVEEFVLDGEIVIFESGHLSFDDLLQRIHPAESRIRRLAQETPAVLQCFDLLLDSSGKSLVSMPLRERREKLESFYQRLGKQERLDLSPVTHELKTARKWMDELGKKGLDGIIAKRVDEPYHSGDRKGMVKIKRIRTADCVVGGFRYAEKGGVVGSFLLGLYNEQGQLDHVGFSSSFNREARKKLLKVLKPLIGGEGFTGKAPGGLSRWSTKRSMEWEALDPKLVCEVQYDHFSGGRFRHGTKFLRWRPEKKPKQCTMDQIRPTRRSSEGTKKRNLGLAG